MAKQLLAKEVPAEDVDEVEQAFQALGATDIKKEKQDDGTFNLEATFPD
jgi:hypothetical protein